ncbi:MAG: DapH/DapD/GlmU-related protein [Promethearchaeota archaeon]
MNASSRRKVTELRREGADIGKDVTILEGASIIAKKIEIGDGVQIGANSRIQAIELLLGDDVRIGNNCTFRSEQIRIGEKTLIGESNDIQPHSIFSMGNISHIGNKAHIRGRLVSFGDEVFITDGLRVGGGGRNEPDAQFIVGDRCTMHNNFINIAKPVTIGNDVGFSPETSLITHGYWQSVLEGYSTSFAPITIHDWVILGYRVIVLPGVEIGERTTVGAGSIVTKSLPARCVAVGVPARVIKENYPPQPSAQEQDSIMINILQTYVEHLIDRKFDVKNIIKMENGILIEIARDNKQNNIAYFRGPKVPSRVFGDAETILLTFNTKDAPPNTIIMNLSTLKIIGEINPLVHDLRDFLRRYGIRFFGYGFFRSLPPQNTFSIKENSKS